MEYHKKAETAAPDAGTEGDSSREQLSEGAGNGAGAESASRQTPPDPAELAAALKQLKSLLTTATDFGDVLHYFFDVVEKVPGFIDFGVAANDPKLNGILAEVFKRWARGKVSALRAQLIEIPEFRFVHGQCFIGSYLGVVIHFQDIGFGLVAVSTLGKPGPTEFVRFRTAELPPDPRVPGGYAIIKPIRD